MTITAIPTTDATSASHALLIDVIYELSNRDEFDTDPAPLLDATVSARLVQDHITPAVAAAEQVLRKMWQCDGGAHDAAEATELDIATLEDQCHDAELPHHVCGFIEAVAHNGNVPIAFLNTLTTTDVTDIDELLETELAGLAYDLRQLTDAAGAELPEAA